MNRNTQGNARSFLLALINRTRYQRRLYESIHTRLMTDKNMSGQCQCLLDITQDIVVGTYTYFIWEYFDYIYYQIQTVCFAFAIFFYFIYLTKCQIKINLIKINMIKKHNSLTLLFIINTLIATNLKISCYLAIRNYISRL